MPVQYSIIGTGKNWTIIKLIDSIATFFKRNPR
uniref:Uncharacterized protein n=1 Tax=Setaria italica TaxID=4555 RepID=K3XUG2_SETIT